MADGDPLRYTRHLFHHWNTLEHTWEEHTWNTKIREKSNTAHRGNICSLLFISEVLQHTENQFARKNAIEVNDDLKYLLSIQVQLQMLLKRDVRL